MTQVTVLDSGREPVSRPRGSPARTSGSEVTDTRPVQAQTTPCLAIERLTVSFDGFKALNDLSFALADGELRCLIGPNGAGKSTLMDVITGRVRPTSGKVTLGEHDLSRFTDWEIARLGVGRKFQRPTILPSHTVRQNLELALRSDKSVLGALFGSLSAAQREEVDRVLAVIGLEPRAADVAGLLPHGQKQWLEIGMLLVQDPRILLLDEPVAGMTHEEMDRTAALFERLAGARTLLVVEHDMGFVRSIARTVTVLHEGRLLAEGSMDAIHDDERVREVYLGHDAQG